MTKEMEYIFIFYNFFTFKEGDYLKQKEVVLGVIIIIVGGVYNCAKQSVIFMLQHNHYPQTTTLVNLSSLPFPSHIT